MNKQQRIEFIEALSMRYKGVDTELFYDNAYQLLVAVILSAQATDVSVNKALEPIFKMVYTPEDMVSYGLERFSKGIKSIGLWRNKSQNVLKMSQDLIDRFQGQVPATREDLMSLAGVGRKTANVVLNVAFGQPTIAVDTHIFRVCNRTFFARGKTPDQVEASLERVVPEEFKREIHIWLIMFGRYVCRAQSPQCHQCEIWRFCRYGQKHYVKN